MEFTFAEALQALTITGQAAPGMRLINPARAPQEYLLAALMPEVAKPTYFVDNAYMLVRATMAGQVGMSSPYPPGGVMELSTFTSKTTKIANEVTLEEEALRQIQMILLMRGYQGEARKEFLVKEVLNFYNKLIVQAHYDTAEWLRMQALFLGELDWKYNGKHLLVDYKVPADHFGAERTGNDAYGGNTSKFWADHYNALAKLNYDVRTMIMSKQLFLNMANNDANKFEILAQTDNTFRVTRYRTRGNIDVRATDVRDFATIVTYDMEGEVLDPADTSKTIKVPFAPKDRILYVGAQRQRAYRPGEGSTPDPARDASLGYTHLAPTVEGGKMGRWGELMIPEDAKWSIRGRGAGNILPVREDVTKTSAKTFVSRTAV